MALDVFHQVLVKVFEAAGGNPRQMVNLADVVRREKLTAHLESISSRLQNDGFIADAPKHDFVFITTWGVEEVKRVTQPAAPPAPVPATPAPAPAPPKPEPPPAPPEPPKAEAKNAPELRQAAERSRELAAVLDELVTSGGTAAQRRAKAKKAVAAATAAVEKAFA